MIKKNDKTQEKKYIVGFEFGKHTSQISYISKGMEEPKTLCVVKDQPIYNFPNVLAKRIEINQWMYGKEAERLAEAGEAELVDNLLEKAVDGNPIVVAGQEFDPIALLALFFKRSLNLLENEINIYDVEGVMFTLPRMDTVIVSVITRAMAKMDNNSYKLYFQSYEESVVSYILHQNPTVRNNNVLLCDCNGEDSILTCYSLDINKKTIPQVITIDTYVNEEFDQTDDMLFEDVKKAMKSRKYSGVFLVGKGFEGNWYPETLRYLIMGKKVFRGSNLYGVGAALSLMEQMVNTDLSERYVYLGPTKLKANVGMDATDRGKDAYIPLLDGGKNWYDEKGECQIIMGDDNEIVLKVTPLTGKDIKNVEIVLDDLPARPRKTTRLKVSLSCSSPDIIDVRVEDLGFGKLFPATHRVWNESFNI